MRITRLLAIASSLAVAPLTTPAAAQAVDPSGNYTWSFETQDNVVRGTLVIVKADTAYKATFTSDHTEGDIPGTVAINGQHVVISTEGDFGQFTVDMVLAGDAPINATFKLVGNDGTATGPFTVERAKKSATGFTTRRFNIGGDGFFDYLSVDTATGRVFVSRGTHVMVVDGATGSAVGDIGNTPRTHGALLVPAENHGFTTNAGDSTSTMFDLKSLAIIRKIPAGIDGLDGFMYDEGTNSVLTINHSRPVGTAVVIDAKSGDVKARVPLSGTAPEAGVADGKGRIFINIENKNAIDVVDTKTWKVVSTWPIAPCEGPTGIAMDRETNRIFAGCSDTSVVVDATTGKVVARVHNGAGVDGLAFDPAEKLLYIPGGQSGNVTVVHEDAPDAYSVVATVPTMPGARTIALDAKRHIAYVFTPEFGPAPTPAPGAPAPTRGRGPRGPIVASWLIAISH